MAQGLTGRQQRAAGRMKDRCIIAAGPVDPRTLALDEETGLLLPPADAPAPLYGGARGGPCTVNTITNRGEQASREGAQTIIRTDWELLLPITAPDIPRGRELIITRSHNPLLLGRVWRVEEPSGGSSAVTRRLVIVEVTRGPVV